MAEYKNKPNTFVLFRNKNKTKETSPDFSGTFVDDDGREFFLDAWSTDPKSGGEKFLSGKRGNLRTKSSGSTPSPKKENSAMSDDIPF